MRKRQPREGFVKRETLWLVLIYCAAHAPLLATTGYFYDDWVLYSSEPRVLVEMWLLTGRPLTGYVLNALSALDGVFIARLWSFLCYLMAGLLLLRVLRTIDLLDAHARFFVVSFFMVFPADSTRVLASLACDSAYYMSFFAGFWLVSLYLTKGGFLYRLAALCSFAFAFWLNSLLVLYALVILYVLYKQVPARPCLRTVSAAFLKHMDFVSLPFVFWAIKRSFPASGIYEGYNQFQTTLFSPGPWLRGLFASLLEPVVWSVIPLDPVQLLAICVGGLVAYWLISRDIPAYHQTTRNDLVLMGVGVLAVACAIFPYVAVGKSPNYWDWASRNSRLVPLGAAIILAPGLRLAGSWLRLKQHTVVFVSCLVLSVLVAGNIKNYTDYWVDWYKALAMTNAFRESPVMRDHTSFLFRDESQDLNAKKRWLRFYEYAALMHVSFGDDSRFGCEEKSWQGNETLNFIEQLVSAADTHARKGSYSSAYHLSHWVPKYPELRVRISQSLDRPSFWALLGLKYSELCQSQRFEKELPDLVRLTIEPVP